MQSTVFSAARRKCYDEVMSHFAIGNTNARGLFDAANPAPSESETKTKTKPKKRKRKREEMNHSVLRLLYLGVGDIRNALSTLRKVGATAKVSFTLNDMSAVTLARNVVLLSLAAGGEIDCATSLWSDALIDQVTIETMQSALKKLLKDENLPKWLSIEPTTLQVLRRHWKAWSNNKLNHRKLINLRKTTIDKFNIKGHGRVGASKTWVQHGILNLTRPLKSVPFANPTCYDLSGKPKFIECQGPLGAFQQLELGKATIHECWAPLLLCFKTRIENEMVSVIVHHGDCATLMATQRLGAEFDAIDTSNLMDYLGLYNLLLLCRPCLKASEESFIFTEQILAPASDLREMLANTVPFDYSTAMALTRLLGLRAQQVPLKNAEEHILRCKWFYSVAPAVEEDVMQSDTLQEKVDTLCEHSRQMQQLRPRLAKLMEPELDELLAIFQSGMAVGFTEVVAFVNECEQEQLEPQAARASCFQSKLFKLFHAVLVPQPMTPEMVQSMHQSVLQGYSFPVHTVKTVVMLVAAIARSACGAALVDGALDRFFADQTLFGFEHVRLRTLALKTECALCQHLRPALSSGVVDVGKPRVYRAKVAPLDSMFRPQGGLLEPALAVCLTSCDNVYRQLTRLGCMYSKQGANLCFDYVARLSGKKLQIIDNLSFDNDNNVAFLLPTKRDKLSFFFLIDVQQYKVLTRLQKL